MTTHVPAESARQVSAAQSMTGGDLIRLATALDPTTADLLGAPPDQRRRPRQFDHAGLEILDSAECLRLMNTVPIGRLVFTEGGLPAVRPVNFIVDGETVVFCTTDGDKHRAADRGDVVAFETDSIDAVRQLGWTVTAVGRLSNLTEPVTAEVSLGLPAHSWTPGRWPHLIRLTIESLRGRRVVTLHPPVDAGTSGGNGPRNDN